MASGTVGTHLDSATIERLKATAAVENRTPSQLQAVAVRSLLDLAPGSRRALFAIHGIGDEAERAYAAKVCGRALLTAYEHIIQARQRPDHHPESNSRLDSEEAIEAEAVRLCRP